MDRMLYVAMSGAQQTLRAQALVSHNLANANTTGFRQDLADFRSMPIFGDTGMPTRVYAMAERSGSDPRLGRVMTTGRDLDIAVQGKGWIAVQGPNGDETYTRAGDLQVDANGLLTTGNGHAVLGNNGPISIPPAEKIEIGADGTLSIRPLGEASTTLVQVDRIKLVDPTDDGLYKDATGLMRTTDGQSLAASADVRLQSGALESSNVNSAEALVSMIESSRRFELQIKMMKVAEDNSSTTNQLLRLE